jgi:hypothetical protein
MIYNLHAKMSTTKSWIEHAEAYRYSQDDRTKQWKYEKSLAPTINAFLDDVKQNSLIVGQFDLKKEPWRLMAIIAYRKYNLKIMEKTINENLVEISVVKRKMQ